MHLGKIFMEKYTLIPDHYLSFLITYLAVLKLILGQCADKESALIT